MHVASSWRPQVSTLSLFGSFKSLFQIIY